MKHWVWLIDILILFLWKLSKNSLVKRLVWNYTKLHLLHFLLYRQISHYLVLYLCCFSCKLRSTDHTALYVMMPNDITSGILTPSDQTKTARKSENTSSTCCFLKVSVELVISRGTNWYYLIPLEGENENTLLTCKNCNYLGLWTQAIWRYFLTAYYKRHSAFSHVADLPDADNSNNENGNTFFLLIFFFFFGGRGRGCEEKVQIPKKIN